MAKSRSSSEMNNNDEQIINRLVILVKEQDNAEAFGALREYLSYYIKLFSRKYRIAGCDPDEIEQECLCALRWKAVEDFKPARGKFRSFAILCLKRHLFSLIKGGNQQKRLALNSSISLNQDHSDGDELSLSNLISENIPSVEIEIERNEAYEIRKERLLSKSSKLERAVIELYLKQLKYEEIVVELRKMFPDEKYGRKSVDNSLQRGRLRSKHIRWEL